MTTTPLNASHGDASHAPTHRITNVNFAHVVNSEWIKLRTLRSTLWCFGIIVILTVGFGFLLAATLNVDDIGPVSADTQAGFVVTVATLGVNFTQLVAAVLGVLIISGEYTTGMIRSTFAAVPRRLPALFAKMLILAVSTFLVGLLSIVVTALVTMPILSGKGVTTNLLEANVMLALVGGAGYLTLIAVLSFTIGAILRNSAGSIASALGLILVVPSVLSIVSAITRSVWLQNVSAFLPSNAGTRMFELQTATGTSGGPFGPVGESDVITLDPTQGFLVLLCWVVVLTVVAAVLIKRRDA